MILCVIMLRTFAFYFQHYIIIRVFLEVTEALHSIGLESLYIGLESLYEGEFVGWLKNKNNVENMHGDN